MEQQFQKDGLLQMITSNKIFLYKIDELPKPVLRNSNVVEIENLIPKTLNLSKDLCGWMLRKYI